MTALARRLPLCLLVDLADDHGPDSARIYSREVVDLSWLTGLRDSSSAGRTLPAQGTGGRAAVEPVTG
jgi:hypothetical protein